MKVCVVLSYYIVFLPFIFLSFYAFTYLQITLKNEAEDKNLLVTLFSVFALFLDKLPAIIDGFT